MFKRLFLVIALFMPLALPAFAAETLETAKAAGYIGERPDGLLGMVTSSPPPGVSAIVSSVNARRLEVFKGIAAKNGQSLAAVQAVSGQEFIDRTPPGQYIMTASGAWVKK